MKDGKALQSGTSHYFGDKFSKAYDVTFTGRDNQLHHPFQTSWGVSTRLVGAIIMTHGDDDGLILPPAVAPIQVVVVPIAAHKPGVSEKAAELAEKISKYARVKLDDSDNAPGWKFSQWEMLVQGLCNLLTLAYATEPVIGQYHIAKVKRLHKPWTSSTSGRTSSPGRCRCRPA